MTETKEPENSLSSRQKIRKWILIISFILVPVTAFYVSPIVIMMGAKEGIATGSMILYVLLFFLSFFVARLWCGWLCPMGAWQEICSPVTRGTVKEGWRNSIKYGVTVLWLCMLGYAVAGAGGIRSVDPFYGTVNGLSISSLDVLFIVSAIFLFIFAVAFFTGRRGFCHVFCPIAGLMVAGRKIRNLIGWPALQLTSDASRCTGCHQCRDACPMGLDVNGMVRKGDMEDAECIMCASCADTCPQGAITYGAGGRR